MKCNDCGGTTFEISGLVSAKQFVCYAEDGTLEDVLDLDLGSTCWDAVVRCTACGNRREYEELILG